MAKKLSPKERRFVQTYLGEAAGNATKAAILAGYAKPSAAVTGSRLLRKAYIAAELAKSQSELANKSGVTAERVVQELARIGFADVRDLFDEHGNLKAVGMLSDDAAAAVVSVEVAREKRRKLSTGATESIEDSVVKVRCADKIGALGLLCRTLGILKDKVEHSGVLRLEDVLDASRAGV